MREASAQPAVTEAFTPETLAAYLAAVGLVERAEQARARVLTGGVSNLAFWVELPTGACVVKQARPRLAVEMEWLADVRRIIREGEAMAWLRERIGPPAIPELFHLDRENMVLVMEAIAPPAENYKAILLRGEVDPALAEQFGGLLARMHNLTRDGETRARFGDAAFFDQLRLSPYYDTVAERHGALAGRIGDLRRECREAVYCLVHGDYSPKNILVREGRLILLDYEVAHFGNPSFDLGFALTHYLCKAVHLPGRGPRFIAAARRFWSVYQAAIELPQASRERAGLHLATIMLARMDGKSPLEYFTDENRRETIRGITTRALASGEATIDSLIADVAARLP